METSTDEETKKNTTYKAHYTNIKEEEGQHRPKLVNKIVYNILVKQISIPLHS